MCLVEHRWYRREVSGTLEVREMNAIACKIKRERADTRISYLSDGTTLMSSHQSAMRACVIILTLCRHSLAVKKGMSVTS